MPRSDEHATQTRRYAYVCMTIVAADFYQFLPVHASHLPADPV